MNMPPGSEHIQRFSRAGGIRRPYRLGCIFHGSMRAWVYVFDHPYFQVTGADGAFQLRDIPAGKYRLEMAHPAGGLRWSEPITVTAGIVSQVTIDVSPDDKK